MIADMVSSSSALCVTILLGKVLCALTVSNECFCVTQELKTLRNPIHIEPTTIDGKEVYLIAEQLGIIRIYDPHGGDNKLTPYIDISNKVVCESTMMEERGLLGFALHPDFNQNKKVYTYSIRSVSNKEYAVISEITDKDVTMETLLMLIEQPGPTHNGGQLLFGDDGFLYVFVGDGDPPTNNDIESQNGTSFLGKILRIDVSQTVVSDYRLQHYVIPDDNPKKSGWRPEVYAIGARNMWRCWVDSGGNQGAGKGRIFCGELGSSQADEINIIEKGGNYGWQYKEGTHCVTSDADCQSIEDEVLPIKEFGGNGSRLVTAVVCGPIYRGSAFKELYGKLVYGDFQSSRLFSLQEDNGNWTEDVFDRCNNAACACDARQYRSSMLLSFGQTHEGELLLLMTELPNPFEDKGVILKLKPSEKSGHVTCAAGSVISRNIHHSFVYCLSVIVVLNLF